MESIQDNKRRAETSCKAEVFARKYIWQHQAQERQAFNTNELTYLKDTHSGIESERTKVKTHDVLSLWAKKT